MVDHRSYRPEFFSGFNFTTAQVVCITAMINHKFIIDNIVIGMIMQMFLKRSLVKNLLKNKLSAAKLPRPLTNDKNDANE